MWKLSTLRLLICNVRAVLRFGEDEIITDTKAAAVTILYLNLRLVQMNTPRVRHENLLGETDVSAVALSLRV